MAESGGTSPLTALCGLVRPRFAGLSIRWTSTPSTHSEACCSEDFRGPKIDGAGDAGEVQQGDVPLASLDLPHVGPVDPRRVRQRLLSEAKRLPLRPDGPPQPQQLLLNVLLS